MVISELSVDEPRLDYLTERFSSHPVWSVWSHLCIPNTNHGFLTQFKPDLSIAPSLYLEWNYKYNNCSALNEIIYCSINILIAVVLTVYIGISFKERLRGSFLTDFFFSLEEKAAARLIWKWNGRFDSSISDAHSVEIKYSGLSFLVVFSFLLWCSFRGRKAPPASCLFCPFLPPGGGVPQSVLMQECPRALGVHLEVQRDGRNETLASTPSPL